MDPRSISKHGLSIVGAILAVIIVHGVVNGLLQRHEEVADTAKSATIGMVDVGVSALNQLIKLVKSEGETGQGPSGTEGTGTTTTVPPTNPLTIEFQLDDRGNLSKMDFDRIMDESRVVNARYSAYQALAAVGDFHAIFDLLGQFVAQGILARSHAPGADSRKVLLAKGLVRDPAGRRKLAYERYADRLKVIPIPGRSHLETLVDITQMLKLEAAFSFVALLKRGCIPTNDPMLAKVERELGLSAGYLAGIFEETEGKFGMVELVALAERFMDAEGDKATLVENQQANGT